MVLSLSLFKMLLKTHLCTLAFVNYEYCGNAAMSYNFILLSLIFFVVRRLWSISFL